MTAFEQEGHFGDPPSPGGDVDEGHKDGDLPGGPATFFSSQQAENKGYAAA